MKKINKYLRGIFTAVTVVWLVFTVLHIILTGKIYLWNFLSNIPTFSFVLIPLFLLVCEIVWKKRKLYVILIIVLSLILGFTQLDINLFRLKGHVAQSNEYTKVKIFDWNTCLWVQDKDKKQFYEFLKKQKADIYILQEYLNILPTFREPSKEEVERRKLIRICTTVPGFPHIYQPIDDLKAIKEAFPDYHITIDTQYVILSRYPIKASYMDKSEQYAVTDIDINGRLVRFYNVHLLLHVEPVSPLRPYFYEALERRFKARKLGLQNLKKDIKNTDKDYFISGDFNSTKAMGVMGDFMEDHIDAVRYSNELLPLTFKYFGLNFWRLDYAFVKKDNKNLMVESYKTVNSEGLSDHHAMSLSVDIKK